MIDLQLFMDDNNSKVGHRLPTVLAFYYLLLFYPTNARLSEPDWSELNKQVDNGKWTCGGLVGGHYCRPRTINSLAEKGKGIIYHVGTIGPNDMDEDEFLTARCHCDDDCVIYDDCCYDASVLIDNSNGTTKNDQQEDDIHLWTCLPLLIEEKGSSIDERYYIYMIGNCPTSWIDKIDNENFSFSYEADLCKRLDPFFYDFLLDLPVLSLDTNRTYANIYCARCHSDDTRIASWNYSIECNKDTDTDNVFEQLDLFANYESASRRWILNDNVVCRIVIEELRNFENYIKTTGSRRCLPREERTCAVDWPDPTDEIKCQAYTLLVQVRKPRKKVFNNPHCAKCNHFSERQIRCYSNKISNNSIISGRSKFRANTEINKFDGSRRNNPFSVLFNLNELFGQSGKRQSNCRSYQTPDDRMCHAIICGSMFVNQDGKCIHKNSSELNQDSAGNLLNSTCPRLTLVENMNYTLLDNGSIILNKSGAVLQPEEYEQSEDGRNITICDNEEKPEVYIKYLPAEQYLSDICLIISIVCLAFYIAIHIVFPKLRNLPGKNLLSLSCAIFMAQTLFLTGMSSYGVIHTRLCKTMGIMIHWFYLAAFFWMNVMGFDICRTFAGSFASRRGVTQGHDQRSRFLYYSLYAWGFPTLIVTLGLWLDLTDWMVDYAPQYGLNICWISNKRALAVLFVLPAAIMLLGNLFLFILTVVSILQQKKAAKFAVGSTVPSRQQMSTNNKHQIRLILYIKLGLIMGLGWIFGIVAAVTDVRVLWYPFIFFNALQGAFIFLAFGCKRKIFFLMYQRVTHRPHPSDPSSSSRTTANSNTNRELTSFNSGAAASRTNSKAI